MYLLISLKKGENEQVILFFQSATSDFLHVMASVSNLL